MNAVPDFLRNRKSAAIGAKAVEGLGTALPPHVSIRSNRFTLVDGAGNEQPLQTLHMDAVVIDVSDVTVKMYFENKWEPGSVDPPTCWSANGIAPSVEAMTPQSPTCASCPKNERGSATSEMTGAAIKACRDEKWLSVIVPSIQMPFQFRVTPGSFKNFRAYFDGLKPYNLDLSDIVTRMEFEGDKTGVIKFQPSGYITEDLFKLREAVLEARATDALVGRNDRPRQAAIAGPEQTAPVQLQAQPQQVQQPGPFAATPAAAAGAPGFAQPNPAPTAATTSPSEPAKRGRRPKAAQSEQPQAPAHPGPTGAPQAPFAAGPAPQAPFAAAQPAAASPAGATASFATQQAAQPANFGIQPGVAPNSEITGLLNSMFGQGPQS